MPPDPARSRIILTPKKTPTKIYAIASVPDRSLDVSTDKKCFVRSRWQMAVTVAIVITVLASLVHEKFSSHNQVIDLQGQVSELRACSVLCNIDAEFQDEFDDHYYNSNGLKNLALIASLTLLSFPVLAL
ncbi:hypothetical protein Tsubulata_020819 [Turnera subulata]|uniref:Uncharacterized protein n=1 Tax=Turnera subulata TaxID=218843 RepID=A0A9Q0JHA2_9ROSI|nr:hypothetical protein Tsubulata_020819 [Turnera subulata]